METHKRRFGLFLVLICPAVALAAIPRNADFSVPTRATPLTTVANWELLQTAGNLPYQWASPDKVLVKIHEVPRLVDVKTGVQTPLTGMLQALAAHPELGRLAQRGPRDWILSPDGQWVLMRSYNSQQTLQRRYLPISLPGFWVAAKCDGSRVVSYPAMFERTTQAIWNVKNDGWMAFTPESRKPAVIHYPLKPGETPKSVALRDYSDYRDPDITIGIVRKDKLVLGSWFNSAQISVIDANRSGLTLERYPIRLPARASAVELEVSPQGDRIAWMLSFSGSSPVTSLSRVLPFIHTGPGQTSGEVWVSDIRGEHMKPLVTGAASASVYNGIRFLRWTPDGSQISFVYDGRLYTVPAS